MEELDGVEVNHDTVQPDPRTRTSQLSSSQVFSIYDHTVTMIFYFAFIILFISS